MERTGAFNLLGMISQHFVQPLSPVGALPDLNGTWRCDDGGLYFIRQIGPDVLWYGEAAAGLPFFANVAHGQVDASGVLRLMWADVPKGIGVACGSLLIHVTSPSRMQAQRITGGFGGSLWTR
jgi:hypothetical protein